MFIIVWPSLAVSGHVTLLSLEFLLKSLSDNFFLGIILIFPVLAMLVYFCIVVSIVSGIHIFVLSKTFDLIEREYAIENWSQLKSPSLFFGGISAVLCALLFSMDLLPIIDLLPKVKNAEEVNTLSDKLYNHPFLLVIFMLSINYLTVTLCKKRFN